MVTPTNIQMKDCIQGTPSGKAEVQPSVVYLKHSTDECTFVCPPTMKSIGLHIEKFTKFHTITLIGTDGPHHQQNDKHDDTLSTGDIVSVGPVKEQYQDNNFSIGGTNWGKAYIDDVNYTITLVNPIALDGSKPQVNPSPSQYHWSLNKPNGDLIDSGIETSKDIAISKIDTYIAAHYGDVINYTCTDDMGNSIHSGTHKPESGWIDWNMVGWILFGIGITVGIIGGIYFYFTRVRK